MVLITRKLCGDVIKFVEREHPRKKPGNSWESNPFSMWILNLYKCCNIHILVFGL